MGKQPRGRPKTRWSDCISKFAWSRFSVEPAKPSKTTEYREVFRIIDLLHPPRLFPKEKQVRKWINASSQRWRSRSNQQNFICLFSIALLWPLYISPVLTGVTRLDGARSKFAAPMFEPEVFRKQMQCIEESTCDNVGTFRRLPQWFGARGLCPSCSPSLRSCPHSLLSDFKTVG